MAVRRQLHVLSALGLPVDGIYLVRNPGQLEGTCHIELLPGKYQGKCWSQTSVFVEERAFTLLEAPLRKHFSTYDHFSFNEIPRNVWLQIVDDWRLYLQALSGNSTSTLPWASIGYVDDDVRNDFNANYQESAEALSLLTTELCEWIMDELRSNDHISVLGL